MSRVSRESDGATVVTFDVTDGFPHRMLEAQSRDGWTVKHVEFGDDPNRPDRRTMAVVLQHLPERPPPPPTLHLAIVLSVWLLCTAGVVLAAMV